MVTEWKENAMFLEVTDSESEGAMANQTSSNAVRGRWKWASGTALVMASVVLVWTGMVRGTLRFPHFAVWSTSEPRGKSEERTFTILTEANDGDAIPWPNIRYATMGYNVYEGDPLPVINPNTNAGRDVLDPGLKKQVFAIEYTLGRVTGDARHTNPDGYHATVDEGCSTIFTTKTIRDEYQYKTDQTKKVSLSARVEAAVKFPPPPGKGKGGPADKVTVGVSAKAFARAGGTLSHQWRNIEQQNNLRDQEMYRTDAKCSSYVAAYSYVKPPPTHPEFKNRVKGLGSADSYFDLFDDFGTHFLTSIRMGARYGSSMFVDRSSSAEMQKTAHGLGVTVDLSVGAVAKVGVSYKSASVGLKKVVKAEAKIPLVTPKEKLAAETFKSRFVKKMTSSLVGPPMPVEGVAAWSYDVDQSPVPIQWEDEVICMHPEIVVNNNEKYLKCVDHMNNYCDKRLKSRGATCELASSKECYSDLDCEPSGEAVCRNWKCVAVPKCVVTVYKDRYKSGSSFRIPAVTSVKYLDGMVMDLKNGDFADSISSFDMSSGCQRVELADDDGNCRFGAKGNGRYTSSQNSLREDIDNDACRVKVWAKPIPEEKPSVGVHGWIDLTDGQVRASQIQDDYTYTAPRAIDGITDTNWWWRSCTETNWGPDPWWKVDLGQKYEISAVRVTNRGDCCADRLDGFEIWTSKGRCASNLWVGRGATQEFACRDISDWVKIRIPRYAYLTLCEVGVKGAPYTPASVRTDCDESMTGDGSDYKGCQTRTSSGYTCQEWSQDFPHAHSTGKSLEGNYCRNPDSEKTIWCYTTDSKKRWDKCDPLALKPACDESLVLRGADYRGCQSKTRSGRTCQRWRNQSPHTHSQSYLDAEDKDFCRNPDNEHTIWCYTSDPGKRWEFCDPLTRRRLTEGANSSLIPASPPHPLASFEATSVQDVQSSLKGGRFLESSHILSHLGEENGLAKVRSLGATTGEYIKNIGKAMYGYNHHFGAPSSSEHAGTDPGFMHRPVWKVSYTTGQTAEEHAFGSVPRGHDIESGRLPPHCLQAGAEKLTGDGSSYRGCQTKTRSGRTCQVWGQDVPHSHTTGKNIEENYCRNPAYDTTIWCYTTDPKKRWENCDPLGTGVRRLTEGMNNTVEIANAPDHVRSVYGPERRLRSTNFKVPDGWKVTMAARSVCDADFDTRMLSSQYDYEREESWSLNPMGFKLDVGAYSFSLSSESREFRKSNSKYKKKMFKTTAECFEYQAEIPDLENNPPPTSDNFKFVVDAAEAEMDFYAIFDMFGLSFPVKVMFGARYGFTQMIEESNYATLAQNSKSFNVGAEVTKGIKLKKGISPQVGLSATVGVSYGSKNSKEEMDKFDSHFSEVTEFSLGRRLPNTGGVTEWVKQISGEPMPFRYGFKSICEHPAFSSKSDDCKSYAETYCEKHLIGAFEGGSCNAAEKVECMWDMDCPDHHRCTNDGACEELPSCTLVLFGDNYYGGTKRTFGPVYYTDAAGGKDGGKVFDTVNKAKTDSAKVSHGCEQVILMDNDGGCRENRADNIVMGRRTNRYEVGNFNDDLENDICMVKLLARRDWNE